MKTCPNCDTSVNDTAKFCRKCGFNIKKYEEENQNATMFCEECGAKITADSTFCEECGFEFENDITNATVKTDDAFDFGALGSMFDSASKQLYALNGLKVENGVLIKYIGKKRNVLIPSTVEEIFDKAFENNEYVTSVKIEEGVRVIGKRAFAACPSLTKISIPASCEKIYENAFEKTKIETLILSERNDEIIKMFLSDEAKMYITSKFMKKENDKLIIDLKLLESTGTEKHKIAEQICCECEEDGVLVGASYDGPKVVIPSTVTVIGKDAFRNESLTNVEIPNSVTTIGESAFSDCTNLTSIELSNSVTTIGDYAFYGCTNLTSIEIPNSVTSIGEGAFADCTNLIGIEIPSSVTSLGKGIIDGCYQSKITISNENANYCMVDGVIYSKDKKTLVEYIDFDETEKFTIPNGVTTIGDGAFSYESLETIEIPTSVTTIGDNAFEWCQSLKNIKIPSSVTTIGKVAFFNCKKLTSIEIPNSVTTIGDYAFNGCANLTTIEIPNNITIIGDGMFECCKNLTSVEIPNRVTTIGKQAFNCCKNLTNIEIPSSVKSIGSFAFGNCENLKTIKLSKNCKCDPEWTFYTDADIIYVD